LRQQVVDHLFQIGAGVAFRWRHKIIRGAKADHGKFLAAMRDRLGRNGRLGLREGRRHQVKQRSRGNAEGTLQNPAARPLSA
jgi:hypothetical protein